MWRIEFICDNFVYMVEARSLDEAQRLARGQWQLDRQSVMKSDACRAVRL